MRLANEDFILLDIILNVPNFTQYRIKKQEFIKILGLMKIPELVRYSIKDSLVNLVEFAYIKEDEEYFYVKCYKTKNILQSYSICAFLKEDNYNF